MIPALITTFLWSYCVVAARKSVSQLGENEANLARILVAVVSLGLIAHFFGLGLSGGGFFYFFLSGVVGFGLGDIGAFYALSRIGTRLTLLMAQCVAAPIAGFGEWMWLGTTISFWQIVAIGVILVGIVIALYPKQIPANGWRPFVIGIGFGFLAALGQGFGAVISRKAYMVARGSGEWPTGVTNLEQIFYGATAGYQRLIGGALIILMFYLISLIYRPWKSYPNKEFAKDPMSKKAFYVCATAFAGPVFGIICFQWALATTPSAIVQPIVAMTPLVVMPMTYFFENDRPDRRAIFGTIISVIGVLFLAAVSL